MGLDQHSPVPKHQQLREILLDLVESAGPETAIPSERELAGRYRVARMTVRQAVESLVAEGRLFKVAGKGTFVAAPKVDMQARLTTFGEEMGRRGLAPSTSVLGFGRTPASAHLARELAVESGEPLVHLARLRSADGTPMAVERLWLPERLVPGLADDDRPPDSVYDTLGKRFGLMPDWGEDVIEAAVADPEVADLLQVGPGGPVLRITRHTYAGQRLVEYSFSLYRADRYQLWVPLARPAPPITNPRKAGPPGTAP
ncbi:MAG: UTRA domain-containing protein [Micromonosporaceae bacterium]|nr:UTRA domain-containing protein [Micromonosporaceae bacterium]